LLAAVDNSTNTSDSCWVTGDLFQLKLWFLFGLGFARSSLANLFHTFRRRLSLAQLFAGMVGSKSMPGVGFDDKLSVIRWMRESGLIIEFPVIESKFTLEDMLE
jgi:hypothetical protein